MQGLISPAGLELSEGAEVLVVAGDGPFTFAATRPAGSAYDVAVARQPVEPWQTCVVAGGSGTFGTADVDDVRITCTTDRHAIGGTVIGLAGAQGLELGNQGERLLVTGEGRFAFATPVASGAPYEVEVAVQPVGATCSASNAAGTVQGAAIDDVRVQCAAVSYTVGGTVDGLAPQQPGSSGLELLKNGGDRLALFADGRFTFPTPVPHGAPFWVSVATQPGAPPQTCVVEPSTAHQQAVTAEVTTVQVNCLTPATAGSLDPAFGTDGVARIDFESRLGTDTLPVLLADTDGSWLLAGTTDAAASKDFALLRLTADGRVDTTFGGGANGGFVRTNVSATGGSIDHARAIGRQSDGRVVVAGYTSAWDFALVRYTADGVLDPSFGSGGVTVTNVGIIDYAFALAVDTSDRIVVAGTTLGTGEDFLVVRYTADGQPDASFNGGDPANTTGAVRTHFSRDDRAQAVAIQPDGRIVAAGYANGASSDFALARYLDDGRLDSSFGAAGTGRVTTPVAGAERAFAMRLQSTGEIVLGGYASGTNGLDFALARYDATGALDPSFGNGGVVLTDLGSRDDRIAALAVDDLGRIVAAGYTFNGLNNDIAIVRYLPTGVPDATFAADGVLLSAIGGGHDTLNSVLVQPDGHVVVAGHTENGSNGANVNIDFVVLRIVP